MRETFVAHTDPTSNRTGVSSLSFSATGQIVTVGMDETLRVWCSP